jgi:hypothetical protein
MLDGHCAEVATAHNIQLTIVQGRETEESANCLRRPLSLLGFDADELGPARGAAFDRDCRLAALKLLGNQRDQFRVGLTVA